ncbi:galactofuranose ABC transporter, ATP-binding protein YtfT [Pectobacterium punjabense]|uniref:ABC transporter permease n=1 Tax=Pectobacterium punjabense TaxID=2108399 RepID=A0ABX6KWX0_9GAMM|nr:galactofuranose ABC transporter, ATP-binding protein YtfT [Pectobacterium punjabense]GKW13986.1 sugar ABC transporter permease [Pectobacterium carotovorum subsp. carotovorum]MBS4433050.1 ABC transporter permease [Pectobacterium punjabense]MBT9185058.1 ABC transporter permease [Pectobacterium punjabense]PTA64527.1 sugar ABC transporter permease [Pectobacterium punjabense]QJA18613.1 ABC transporter permease [Pectobacterium punjabense]
MTDNNIKPAKKVRLTFTKGVPQLLALVAILLIDSMVAPNFFSLHIQDGRLFGSLIDILNRGAPVALLALGMTLVIATGGIDLSVGAVMAIAGATAATLTAAGHPLPSVLLAALLVGALCGLWNGFLVAVLQIQPIVATLMLMVAGRGIAQLITEGQIITFDNAGLAKLGSGTLFYLPMPVMIACVVLLALWALTRKTALGLFIESVGINLRSARNAGVSTKLVLVAAYVICGVCAAVAGVIVTADIRGADANNAGLWLELDAILAVVIGGGSLLGGRFNLLLSVVGALIIQSMNTGILLSGYRPEFNLVLKALVVLLVLVMQSPRISLHQLFRRKT